MWVNIRRLSDWLPAPGTQDLIGGYRELSTENRKQILRRRLWKITLF